MTTTTTTRRRKAPPTDTPAPAGAPVILTADEAAEIAALMGDALAPTDAPRVDTAPAPVDSTPGLAEAPQAPPPADEVPGESGETVHPDIDEAFADVEPLVEGGCLTAAGIAHVVASAIAGLEHVTGRTLALADIAEARAFVVGALDDPRSSRHYAWELFRARRSERLPEFDQLDRTTRAAFALAHSIVRALQHLTVAE